MRLVLCAISLLWSASLARADIVRFPTCFVGPVFIAGVAEGQCLTPAVRDRLVNAPVVDWNRKPVPLTMSAEGNSRDKMTVSTCREWTAAVSLNRAAMRAQDPRLEQFYARTCQTLDALALAEPATISFLEPDGSDLAVPERVPARLLEICGIKGPPMPEGTSVADLQRLDGLVMRDHKIGKMEVSWRNQDIVLNPTARADVDRNGIEDLVVAMDCVLRGSRRGATIVVELTRLRADGPMQVTYPKPRG